MVRGLLIALGIGLIILWLVGLEARTADWLMWVDFAAGIASIIAGIAVSDASGRNVQLGVPVVISIWLFVLWIVALALYVVAWKTWWTFAFACAYLLLAFAAGTEREPAPRRPHAV